MRLAHTLLTLVALGGTAVNAISEFEVLEATKVFVESFLTPRNAEIARSINSTLFAEDVRGTVDASTNFDGRELSTEYLFGLWAHLGEDPNDPSPLGIPVAYEITHLLVQGNTVAGGVIFDLHYNALNRSYPVELEVFYNYNDRLEITEYDVIIRRWAWAEDVIIPQLIPHMAESLQLSGIDNSTYILQQYMARKACQGATMYCNGTNQQYDSYDDCMVQVTDKPNGRLYRLGEDSLGCRWMHVNMLALRPDVHCPHVGPSGGDMCIARDYTEVVRESHFIQGFVAPKVITPENRDEVERLSMTDPKLMDLMEISLGATRSHSWDPTLFATCTFGFLLVLYGCSNLFFFLFNRYNRVFPLLRTELQKNVVMYTLNIIFTGVALALQLAATPVMANRDKLWEIQTIRTSAAVLCGLYCFELIYRFDMRWPLIVHHILTIIAVAVSLTALEITQSTTYVISAIIWGFQATTEQTIFVGLMGYRLKWEPNFVAKTLKWSAVQTLIVKCGSAIALLIYWGINQSDSPRAVGKAYSATVWIIAFGLLCTQFWGSLIAWKLGVRVEKQGNCDSGKDTRLNSRNTSMLPFVDIGQEPSDREAHTSGTSTPAMVQEPTQQPLLHAHHHHSYSASTKDSRRTLPDLDVGSRLDLPWSQKPNSRHEESTDWP